MDSFEKTRINTRCGIYYICFGVFNIWAMVFNFIPEKVSNISNSPVNEYVKAKRKALGLSREELALKAGVGLRFLRELEQGKETLKMDKVNQVLKLF